MIRKLIFNSVMWVFVKLRIADKLVMTTGSKQFNSYILRGDYP